MVKVYMGSIFLIQYGKKTLLGMIVGSNFYNHAPTVGMFVSFGKLVPFSLQKESL